MAVNLIQIIASIVPTEDVAFVWLSIDFVTAVQNESQIGEYCSMSTAVSKQMGEIYLKEDMHEFSLH